MRWVKWLGGNGQWSRWHVMRDDVVMKTLCDVLPHGSMGVKLKAVANLPTEGKFCAHCDRKANYPSRPLTDAAINAVGS